MLYEFFVCRRKLLNEKRNTEEVPETIPLFSFPLRDRVIQEGIGVKLIACVDGLPHPKVCVYVCNFTKSQLVNIVCKLT